MSLRGAVARARQRLAGVSPKAYRQRLRNTDDHITKLYHHHLDVNHRIHLLEQEAPELGHRLAEIEKHMPAVLNSIASANGTARLLQRSMSELEERVDERIETTLDALRREVAELADRLGHHVTNELWPLTNRVAALESHGSTIEYLLNRIETVRAEMLHELRYGRDATSARPSVEIVNEAGWEQALETGLRLNLGCGHIPLEGFINVDMRKLPGVDVVAPVDELPVVPGSVAEIFSAHMLEHFPPQDLERRLLPYWVTLLRPGGTFRAVVPDHDAMIEQYGRGEIEFVTLREVTYGGQEYEGDFHYNAFTPATLEAVLRRAGLDDVELIARARPNGDCLEFEMSARRPE